MSLQLNWYSYLIIHRACSQMRRCPQRSQHVDKLRRIKTTDGRHSHNVRTWLSGHSRTNLRRWRHAVNGVQDR